MSGRFLHADVEQSIPDCLARRNAGRAGRAAIRSPSISVTYEQLDAWSDAIAERIVGRRGDGCEPVALLLPQGPLAIAATLGILKAGKFYAPLDPSWPSATVRSLVGDLSARIVLTNGEFAPTLVEQVGQELTLALPDGPIAVQGSAPRISVAPDQPAYVYFTSGTTGRPKGVIDCHRNVLHNVMRYTNALDIDARDRLTLLQSVGFSGAVSSMFAALLNGAVSCPMDMRTSSPARLADWIEEMGVTIYHSVPAIFRSLASPGRVFRSVRVVRLEGDRASRRDIELFRTHFAPPSRLAIGLGTTETGLVCQAFFDHESELPAGVVPVGRAAQDMRFEVLGPDGRPCAAGHAGEIVVHSHFLATGYWRNPQAEQRAFADEGEGIRSYRTGDLGRLREDGSLEHLGRLDGRIRIRGLWVELADVDAALAALPGVREAVAGAVDDGSNEPQLAAWFVADGQPAPSVSTLRRQLAARLAPHALPSRYVELDRLPLNANGKVDRSLLPVPPSTRPRLDSTLIEPRSLVQLRLRELWEEMLNVAPVGVQDDFFDLGGHSLLAVAMMDRVEEICGRRLPLSVLLGGATIERLAGAVLREAPELEAPIVPIRTTGSRPPLFFLHGDYLSGGIYCLELARQLGQEQPFYAVPPSGFDGKPPLPTYEAMAERHLEAIRAICPSGPYLLAGQCNGGLVAYEIARRLEAAGEGVALVAMITASADNLRFRQLHAVVDILGRTVGMADSTRRYAFDRLRSFVVHQGGLAPTRRVRHAASKVPTAIAEALRFARAWRGDRRTVADRGPEDPMEHRSRLWETFQGIDRAYMPGPYHGTIHLIWPQEDAQSPVDAAGWWKRVAGSVELSVVAGTHATSLTRHVTGLAKVLEAAISRASEGPVAT